MGEPIISVQMREIHLPLVEPFRISTGVVENRRILLLRLTDAASHQAWSECVAMALPIYSPDTIDTCWLALKEWVIPRILGKPFKNARQVHDALAADFRGHLMAKAAVEMGWWGLEAARCGLSLADLLEDDSQGASQGATRLGDSDSKGATRIVIRTGISLGIQENPKVLIEKVRQAVDEGYAKVKIKIKPGADIEYLEAVREALGPEPELMADANSAYSLNDIEHLKKFDNYRLMMIEQPLAWDDQVQHAELQKHLQTPICLDESITDLNRARDMLALDSGRIINIKPGRVGGFTAARDIHDLCYQNQVPVWCGGMLESGIGRAYNVALASLKGFTLPGDVSPSARYWQQDIVTPEWTMDSQGNVTVPRNQTGIGVEVDIDRIENLTVRAVSIK